jgi:hypothetical protein
VGRIWAVAVAFSVSGCLTEPDCSWHGEWWYGNDLEFAVQEHRPAYSGRVFSPNPGSWLGEVSGIVTVENPTEHDCVIAVYVSDTQPSPAVLPALGPEEEPPDTIKGLGTLEAFVNLSRAWDSSPDLWQEEVTLHGESKGDAVDHYLTVVTCVEAGMTGSIVFRANWCDTAETPREREEVRPGSFQVTEVW